MKSLLYAANTSAQSLSAGNTISVGSPIVKTNCKIGVENGNVVTHCPGIYHLNYSVTLTASVAGTATIALYRNGFAIPGATSSVSITNDDTNTLSVSAIIKNCCPLDTTITAVLSNVGASVSNATAEVIGL